MGLCEAGGKVEFDGKPIPLNNPRKCLDASLAFVSEDRRDVGLLLDETLEWNIAFSAMQIHDKFLKKYLGGMITWRDEKAIHEVTQKYIDELKIKCTSSKQKAKELSGGNQQKVCLAKAFALEPKFLFVSEPTRGIDVGAKSLVLDALKQFNKEHGVTVVMISSELEELRTTCDRIAIVSGGKIAGILPATESSEEFGCSWSARLNKGGDSMGKIQDSTINPGKKTKIRELIDNFGLPRLIIAGFLLALFILAPIVGADLPTQITNTINRFSWNAVLVLAMVPMVHSGCGLNFGLPLGIISGLLGATMSIQFGFTGPLSFFMAILIATPFALIFGGGYGWLLNKIKGGEMMIATYVGFSSVSFMCMMWLLLPYSSPTMVWGLSGKGLRTTISLEGFYDKALANFLQINIGKISIPTGSLLFFAFLAFLMWAFLHTKTGTAMTAVGSNPNFARASGINIDKTRMLSVIMSTWLAAVGILMYEQGFGFIQLYMAPFYMALPAVSAILIGGASVNKASITNVIIGTFLFQGIVTMTPTVMNSMIHMDMSEVIRIVVSNGMILYALTRKTEGSK